MNLFKKLLPKKKDVVAAPKSNEPEKQPGPNQKEYVIVAHAVDGREITRFVYASSEHEAVFALEKKTLHEGGFYYPHSGIVKYEVIR